MGALLLLGLYQHRLLTRVVRSNVCRFGSGSGRRIIHSERRSWSGSWRVQIQRVSSKSPENQNYENGNYSGRFPAKTAGFESLPLLRPEAHNHIVKQCGHKRANSQTRGDLPDFNLHCALFDYDIQMCFAIQNAGFLSTLGWSTTVPDTPAG